jgi:serralysin
MVNENRWCFAWFAEEQGIGKNRAALAKSAKWNSGDIITVSFLDGNENLQQKVKQAALGWTAPGLANLTLQFLPPAPKTLIRISFSHNGSWSAIGTTCKQIVAKNRPTMNFGWLNIHSVDEEIQQVVLHEFGHALGLIHEHQNPSGQITWNRQVVIDDLSSSPNNWSLDVIEQNVFAPHNAKETNFTQLDPKSIMMYPIPAQWTSDGFSTELNHSLSMQDRRFIQQQYP